LPELALKPSELAFKPFFTEFGAKQEQDFLFCIICSISGRISGLKSKILLDGKILLDRTGFQHGFVDQNQELRENLFKLYENLCA
jgi:hypothetical protein